MEKKHEIVVFGATGFTGSLVVRYLAEHGGLGRWAIAGRNRDKLEELRARTLRVTPDARLDVVVADSGDRDSLGRMANDASVVLTTAGPFAKHGEPVVRACIDGGAHYADITGEPEYVDRLLANYDAIAAERGLRIVSCCGFDSIPHDLGALMIVDALQPVTSSLTVEGFVRSRGRFSGGTWTSAIEAFADFRAYQRGRKNAKRPRSDRRVRSVPASVRFEPRVRAWVCVLPTIDPQIVKRSARAMNEYGPDFRYGHYAVFKNPANIALGAAAVGGIFLGAQIPAIKKRLLEVQKPGEGPSERRRARHWFEVRFVGRTEGRTIEGVVAGGDPGYDETAKMVSEAAISLLREETRDVAGVLTPAQAFGMKLVERLRKADMTFRID
jgi:short subunit dehydrogenase-like uncharacterized protein